MEETAERSQIVDLGIASDRSWPGKLSAKNISVDMSTLMKGLDALYVATDPLAKTRCIDGRYDPHFDEAHLGAQVPGGAPGAALAYRLGVDKDDLTRGTFYNDAEMMIEAYIRLGLAPGGHRDDSSSGGAVGCGAIDGMDSILINMTNPDLVEDHKRLVKALMDKDFDREHYLRVMGAGLVLRSRAQGYFSGRGGILDLLEEKAPGSVSVLEGQHEEALVIVNFVPNSTLSSNRFAEHYGIQAFGYDLWRSKQLALNLFPLPSQENDRSRFVMARVMITIATLMTLTDGSLRMLVRIPTLEEGSD